jgi:hypothetical protein
MPALIVKYLSKQIIDRNKSEFLNLSISLLLPEIYISKARVLKIFGATKKTFKVGDEIAGIKIVNVRPGTNGKIAIIGRRMEGHVKIVAQQLKNEGKVVEILDDAYLNREFMIDGEVWTVNKAFEDMMDLSKYRKFRDANLMIKSEHILDIPMGKLNKQWIDYIQKEGYTILDMGYPSGTTIESAFYNMEVQTIIWK